MSNLPSNSLQEGEHNLQEMKTKSPAWSSKGYHMYELKVLNIFFVTKVLEGRIFLKERISLTALIIRVRVE